MTVLPLTGNFVITPANSAIGLGLTRQFGAGLEMAGIGVIPLKDVVWRVNGVPGGGVDRSRSPAVDLGRIDVGGLYRAPGEMPGPLPFGLTIGFSTAVGQAPLAQTDVTLVELTAGPSTIVGLTQGVAGTITGVRRTSGGAQIALAGADLAYASADRTIATANPQGDVSVGETLGQTVILVADKMTGARDTVTVYSRTEVALSIDVIEPTFDTARVSPSAADAAEIEYTCPDARFEVRANVTRLRGPQAGSPMTGRMRGSVTMTSDNEQAIVPYEPPEAVPQATGVLATLRTDTGLVTPGDEPGSGVIKVRCDDGFVTHEATLTLIFTRPDITVQTVGRWSGSGEPFLTEDVEVTIQATNNGGFSDFTGELSLRVTLLDWAGQTAERMDVFYRNSPFSGHAWGWESPLNLGVEVDEMDLTLASTLDPLEGCRPTRLCGTGPSPGPRQRAHPLEREPPPDAPPGDQHGHRQLRRVRG